MAANVKIHVNALPAESTQDAPHLIRHNVCASLASKETHYKAASMTINAQHTATHARTELNVFHKKVATNACVQMAWPAIHIKAAVSWRKVLNWFNADIIPIVLALWLVFKAVVLVHANRYNAAQMHIASQKIMQLGVDAVLALRKMKMAIVFQVSVRPNYSFSQLNSRVGRFLTIFYFSPYAECNDYYCGQSAICIVTRDGPTCKCPQGLLGNPFPGGICVTDQCSSTQPCSDHQVCIGGRCKHRCENIVCGVGATCDQSTGRCVCEPNFVGSPDYLCMPRK